MACQPPTRATSMLTARSFQAPDRVFSMEIALSRELPTYSGGLGMLAGDTLRSAADMAAPMVAVSLAHRRGYFRQNLDSVGQQTESPVPWSPETTLPAHGRWCPSPCRGARLRSAHGGTT